MKVCMFVLVAMLITLPVYGSGNHEHGQKNGHKKSVEPPTTTTTTPADTSTPSSNKSSKRVLYAVAGAVGVYAIWSWGKKDNDKKGVQFGVRVQEGGQ